MLTGIFAAVIYFPTLGFAQQTPAVAPQEFVPPVHAKPIQVFRQQIELPRQEAARTAPPQQVPMPPDYPVPQPRTMPSAKVHQASRVATQNGSSRRVPTQRLGTPQGAPSTQNRIRQVAAWQQAGNEELMAPVDDQSGRVARFSDQEARWRQRTQPQNAMYQPPNRLPAQGVSSQQTWSQNATPATQYDPPPPLQNSNPASAYDQMQTPVYQPQAQSDNYQAPAGNQSSVLTSWPEDRSDHQGEFSTIQNHPSGSAFGSADGESVLVETQSNASSQIQSQPMQVENRLRAEPRRMKNNGLRNSGLRRGRPSSPSRFQQASDSTSYYNQDDEQNLGPRGLKTCDEFRAELLDNPITEIVVDFSPLRPEAEAQVIPEDIKRTWTTCAGEKIITGTLVGLQRSYAEIEDEEGKIHLVSLARLSDADLSVITEFWALPNECSLGCDPYLGRSWHANTLWWKASSLCHKPLYFENIQLERYGHSSGPIMEPLRSSAHFFVSLALWPYQTGIHPGNECVYALGYYRPGNCAPWIREPFPISLAGAVRQTAAIAALGAFIP